MHDIARKVCHDLTYKYGKITPGYVPNSLIILHSSSCMILSDISYKIMANYSCDIMHVFSCKILYDISYKILQELPCKITKEFGTYPGVILPYLYVRSWKNFLAISCIFF